MFATEEDYEKHKRMIHERAWSWHRTSRFDFDELLAQANLIYCEARKSFDPEAGTKFSTWLYKRLNHGLGTHVRHLVRKALPLMQAVPLDFDLETPATQDRNVSLFSRLAEISEEARHVAALIIHAPAEVFGMVAPLPHKMRTTVRRHLQDQGMSLKKSRKVLRELRAAVYNN